MANDERQTNLIFRTMHNTRASRRMRSATRLLRRKSGAKFEDIKHLVTGVRGRAGLESGDTNAGIWSAGMVQGLIRHSDREGTRRPHRRGSRRHHHAADGEHGRHARRRCGVSRCARGSRGRMGRDHLAMVEREKPVASGRTSRRADARRGDQLPRSADRNRAWAARAPAAAVPFSDGAGEVIAVGEGVTRQGSATASARCSSRAGRTGRRTPPSARPLGGRCPACCRTRWRLTPIMFRDPRGWSFEEAATLPCAGLTAWRALMVEGEL